MECINLGLAGTYKTVDINIILPNYL